MRQKEATDQSLDQRSRTSVENLDLDIRYLDSRLFRDFVLTIWLNLPSDNYTLMNPNKIDI